MLSPIITDCYASGVLPENRHRTLINFFPNCNLSVRRSALEDVGFYDERCTASEDVDLCRRVSSRGWRLYYEPRAACFHEPRKSLTGLMKQWYWYGKAAAFVFKRHQSERFEIFLSLDPRPRIFSYRRILHWPAFPVQGLLFLNPFTLLSGLLLVCALGLVLKLTVPASLLLLPAILFMVCTHVRNPALRGRSTGEVAVYYLVTLVINLSCTWGGLVGGMRNRILYLHPGV